MVGLEEATRWEGARALKSGAERLRSRWISATRSGERFREGHLREEFDDGLGSISTSMHLLDRVSRIHDDFEALKLKLPTSGTRVNARNVVGSNLHVKLFGPRDVPSNSSGLNAQPILSSVFVILPFPYRGALPNAALFAELEFERQLGYGSPLTTF